MKIQINENHVFIKMAILWDDVNADDKTHMMRVQFEVDTSIFSSRLLSSIKENGM